MKKIVMIGSPLTHVRSPAIINPMLRAAGENVEVVVRELSARELAGFAEATRDTRSVIGLIVTTPLKQAICSYLDRRTAIVESIGASNCIRCDGRSWFGANFDGYGFVGTMGERMLAGRRILLIGCGGAGSAIAASVAVIAEIELFLFDLDFGKAETLALRIGRLVPRSKVKAIVKLTGNFDIVVNASTSGMREDDPSPVPTEIIAGAQLVADIVVDRDTALKRDARRHGKRVIDGNAMVESQASYLKRFILGSAQSERDVLAD
jgi:shikimate dehydrogenase